MHVLPSDHAVVVDEDYFDAVRLAATAARTGRLVTFGIVPTAPETGYGYIEAGEPIDGPVRAVRRFIEKPDRQKAEELVAAGGFSWNSGMFMLGAGTFLDECAALAPDDACGLRGGGRRRPRPISTSSASTREAFADGAEHLGRLRDLREDEARRRAAGDLRLVGSRRWDAVWKASPRDGAGNASVGPVTLSDTSNSFVLSERAHVAVEGLDDIAVIASEDAIYVGRLSQAQKVGSMVKALKGRPETAALTEIHRTAYRPWGGYTSVLSGERFQVKRLFVKPGKKLSLQKHHHRSEHWIVVRGTAEVTIDGTVTQLTENQSIYLPLGCVHRLANPGKILLELIEVQTGSYLGEDDIIRIEDEFGRA